SLDTASARSYVLMPFISSKSTGCTGLSTLSLHDALPISYFAPEKNVASLNRSSWSLELAFLNLRTKSSSWGETTIPFWSPSRNRSEEHTSELQSLAYLVCRLLLEKKN